VGVHLHAERIDPKLKGPALIVERIDHEATVSSLKGMSRSVRCA
jgi:hypothetical protein